MGLVAWGRTGGGSDLDRGKEEGAEADDRRELNREGEGGVHGAMDGGGSTVREKEGDEGQTEDEDEDADEDADEDEDEDEKEEGWGADEDEAKEGDEGAREEKEREGLERGGVGEDDGEWISIGEIVRGLSLRGK